MKVGDFLDALLLVSVIVLLFVVLLDRKERRKQ